MTDQHKISSIVFMNTLHDNPTAQYPKFRREAKQIAFRLMQEFVGYPAGLLFLVLTPAEYDLIPQVTIGGVIQPPNIPVYPANPGAGATAADLEVYRQEYKMCIIHWQTVEAYKSAVLVAMGSDLVQEIADPMAGEAVTMDTPAIFQHLEATYGVLTSADVRDLKMELEQPIAGDDMKTYVKFASNFSTIVLRLQTAGQALPAFEQMELFTNSTSSEPNIAKAIEKYVDNNPVLAARTLPQMIAAVRISLSNIPPTSTKSGYSALAATSFSTPELLQKLADLEAKFSAVMQQKPPTLPPSGKMGKAPPRKLIPGYCYLHGHCYHPGSQCRTMLADRTRYTNAMRKAKTPTDVAGGSTKG